MSASIIDGKAAAQALRDRLAIEVSRIDAEHSWVPGLAVVLVGEDPASQVYVRNKGKQTAEAGMRSFEHKLPASTSERELLDLVESLNRDDAVNGILVQLPLPEHIDAQLVIETIDPAKDVDGFHPMNTGALSNGDPTALVPCTPLGCLMMLREQFPEGIAGLNAVVVGRSNIVGKPMAQLLIAESCTVTVAHSKTRDLPALCRTADILVAAVGRPEMVRGDWVKEGAVVIDVGINRVQLEGQEKARLVGDVAFAEAAERAKAITPVPGGVGPMTIACLLRNTVVAACRQHRVVCELG
ncbi:bifunctional methylenetetrahydrofolate dehydrogenase/methenyltetrahydrofolate cyclohydrolase FolD [Congregibacter litoralis]|uniref:Bifunctional protein FolD n=1 Tax=Congregibacter litoralis KT71 TaxID=314285 RepID=A4AC82_9GAMM|nr:bifunctional methylenetetrahydrofolate dehydrogenase/methenyltetrahydrofolate cyclohydrolase FolD [Congregibacter litoralis]EAQ96310.1 5,10-methylene-tetrahydrofolate dehydrogenase/Methenyl tetrahydrofolate cyclohydrolase [Congregibacter litoralis KT71]